MNIPDPLVQRIVNYLSARPWREVEALMSGLKTAVNADAEAKKKEADNGDEK